MALRCPRSSVATFRTACLAILGTLTVAGATLAAEHPLDAIPENASVVLRFKKPKATFDNFVKFATSLDKNFGRQASRGAGELGELISNPKREGLDIKYDWYVVLISNGGLFPDAVYAIPATNHDTMEAAVKKAMFDRVKFARHDNWLLYSSSDKAIESVTECLAKTTKPVSESIDRGALTLMDQHDVSAYVNVTRLTQETFKIELDAIKTELDEMLKDPAAAIPGTEGVDLKPVFESYGQVLRQLYQAVGDTRSVTIGISTRSKGIDLEFFIGEDPSSPTAELLKSAPPSNLSLLEHLPANRLIYGAVQTGSPAASKWALTMARAFVKDDSTRSQVDSAIRDFDQIQFGTTAFAMNGGDGAARKSISIVEMRPTDKAREMTRKTAAAFARLDLGQVSQTAELSEGAETINGQSIDLLVVKATPQTTPAATPANPGAATPGAPLPVTTAPATAAPPNSAPPAAVETTMRIAYLPDYVVQTTGGGQAQMEEALQGLGYGKVRAGATASASATGAAGGGKLNTTLIPTRTQLSPQANFVFLADLSGMAAEAMKIPEPQLRNPPKRTYFGLSVTTEPAGIRVKSHLPVAQIQGLGRFSGQIESLFRGAGAPGGPRAIP